MSTSIRSSSLERRLQEACDELWQSLVDPREAWCDVDGTRWLPLGGPNSGGVTAAAIAGEHEHAAIRNQCRTLALSNEFAINGHENRVTKTLTGCEAGFRL